MAGVAPPGRTGEALATVGVFNMMAGLLGNMAVATLNPYLLSSGMPNPLWAWTWELAFNCSLQVYYPFCGFLVLLVGAS